MISRCLAHRALLPARPRPCAARPPAQSRPGVRPTLNRAAGEDHSANSDGQVESLFAQELARRAAGGSGPSEPVPPPPAWATDDGPDDPPPPQLVTSRALSSEGLSGLLPRARALLTLGVSFSAAFAGLAAVAAALFIGLAAAFGPSFVHGGAPGAGLPPYVDPYSLIDTRGLVGTDGPNGPMPPPPPGYKKQRAEAVAKAAAVEAAAAEAAAREER